MKRILFVFTLLFSFHILSAQESDRKKLEEFLSKQQDITYERIETYKGGPLLYKLQIKQPLDWSDTHTGYFNQQVILPIQALIGLCSWKRKGMGCMMLKMNCSKS